MGNYSFIFKRLVSLRRPILAGVVSLVYWLVSCPLAYTFEISQLTKSVPQDKGAVSRIAYPTSPSNTAVVFYLQDIHASPEAQESIGSMVKELQSKNQLGFIALEGLTGSLNFDRFHRPEVRMPMEAAANYLLEEMEISGPVHAAMVSKNSFPTLQGVEEASLYRSHIRVYQKAAPHSAPALESIRKAEVQLRIDLKSAVNPHLAEYHRAVQEFKEGRTPIGAYIQYLSKSKTALPRNIQTLRALADAEGTFQIDKVKTEQAALLGLLARKLNAKEQFDLKQSVAAMDRQKAGLAEFFASLKNICAVKKISLDRFPSLKAYMEAAIKGAGIEMDALDGELASVEGEIYGRLIRSAKEKSFIQRDQFYSLSRKLVRFALTSREWKDYLALKRDEPKRPLKTAGLFERFYELACLRDEVMCRNLLKIIEKSPVKTGILVAGGFHAEGIIKRFKNRGVTVISVLPTVTEKSLSGDASYLDSVSPEPSPFERILETSVATLSPPVAKGAWMAPFLGVMANHLDPKRPLGDQKFAKAVLEVDVRASVRQPSPDVVVGKFLTPLGALDVSIQNTAVVKGPDGEVEAIRIGRASVTPVKGNAWAPSLISWGKVQVDRLLNWWAHLKFGLPEIQASRASTPLLLAFAAAAALSLALIGCSTPTPYYRGSGDLAPFQVSSQFSDVPRGSVPAEGWLNKFKEGPSGEQPSARLEGLVDEALQNNPNIRIAESRVRQAQLFINKARSELFPTIDLSRGLTHISAFYEGITNRGNLSDAGVNLNWDLDIFGANKARLKSTKAGAASAEILSEHQKQILAALVVQSDVLYTAAHKRVAITKEYLRTLEEMQKIDELAFKNGVAVITPAARHELGGDVESARSQLEHWKSLLFEAEKTLITLLGRDPNGNIPINKEFPIVQGPVNADTPFEVLMRRPDVRAALAQVKKGFWDSVAAHADRFPKLYVIAGFHATREVSDAANPTLTILNAGTQLLAPIVDWNRNKSQFGIMREAELQAVENLHLVVLDALREVVTRYNLDVALQKRESAQKAALGEYTLSIEAARLGFDLSGGNPVDILRLENRRRDAELQLLEIQSQRIINAVMTNVALGIPSTKPLPAIQQPTQPPAKTAPPSAKPAKGRLGGAWFKNPSYLASAWKETPITAFISFFLQTAVVIFGGHIISPASLPWVIAGLGFAFPLLFWLGHFLGNKEGLFSSDVLKLTAAKGLAALLGGALILSQQNLQVVMAVQLLSMAVITIWHKSIQMEVVENLGLLPKKVEGQAARRLPSPPAPAVIRSEANFVSDASMDLTALLRNPDDEEALGRVEGFFQNFLNRQVSARTDLGPSSSHRTPPISQPPLRLNTDRLKSGLRMLTDDVKRRVDVDNVQARLRSLILSSIEPAVAPAALRQPADDLKRLHRTVVVVDDAVARNLKAGINNILANHADDPTHEFLFLVESDQDGYEDKITGLLSTRFKFQVAVAPSIFEADQDPLFFLTNLENFLSQGGFLSDNPALEIFASAGMLAGFKGSLPYDSLLRTALFIVLTQQGIIPLTYQSLSDIERLLELVAQQA